MAKVEACPECGSLRQGGSRYCDSCRYDFESLAHRYRGTEWSTAPAYTVPPRARKSPTPEPPRPQAEGSLLYSLGRIVAFYLGLAIVAAVCVSSTKNGTVPDLEFNTAGVLVMIAVSLLAAGLVTQIIPGHHARGLVKSVQLAFVGWMAAGLLLFFTSRLFIGGIGTLHGAIGQGLVAISAASVIRVALFVIEWAATRMVAVPSR